MFTTFCRSWPRGIVGDASAPSKGSGKSTGLTPAAHAAAGVFYPRPDVAGARCRSGTTGRRRCAPREHWHIPSGRPRHTPSCATAFDEDVVRSARAAVHADPHAGGFQRVRRRHAAELRTLIGVEDLWPTFPERTFERIQLERGVRLRVNPGDVRQTPRQGRSGSTSPSLQPDREA